MPFLSTISRWCPPAAAVIVAAVVYAAAPPAPASAAEAQAAMPPAEVIKRFQGALLAVMKTAKFKSVEERFQDLSPHVSDTFHTPLMARIVVGDGHWKKSDAEQQKAFVEAFRRYNVASLATMLYTFSGQKFIPDGERPGPQGTHVVDTRLQDSDGSVVKIAYVMKNFGGRWRALDVVLDGGISELTVRRSEYSKVLREQGMPALGQQLSDKAARLLNE